MLPSDALTELVSRKLACLARLHELGRRQLALVDEGNMDRLIETLAAKQQLLPELQTLERALQPWRDQPAEQRAWRSEADRQRCAELLAQAERLFREILVHEKHSEERLVRRRDEAAQRLAGAHTATFARSAYSADGRRAQVQLDLTVEN